MTDVPLIYTSKGNLPVDSLRYSTSWENTDDYVKLTETYSLDGEVVKQSAHVMAKKSFLTEAISGTFA
jgi:hypothetical protein